MAPSVDPALSDLHWLTQVGLERGANLLTAGELVVCHRLLALAGDAGNLYARLSNRVPTLFRIAALDVASVRDAAAAAAELIQRGLADTLAPWSLRGPQHTVRELAALARRYGVLASGRKAELVQRIAPFAPGYEPGWIRIRHRPLVQRLERWALMQAHADRSTLVVERLGVVRWPRYTPTVQGALHRNRAALRAWERALHARDIHDILRALRTGAAAAPGGLDRRRALRRIVRQHARGLERAGEPFAAAALYARLVEDGHERLPRIAVRWARSLEALDDAPGAIALLRRARRRATACAIVQRSEQLAIGRAGRRLAARLRCGWAPQAPLRTAPVRAVRLAQHSPPQGRPRWRSDAQTSPPQTVEQALCTLLAGLGRVAVHGEARPWRTLFALLFADCYFLPIAGALPGRFLSGPTDLGTPAFVASRQPAIRGVWRRLEQEDPASIIRAAHDRWAGCRLTGACWDVNVELLASLATDLGPQGLRAILEPLLAGGPRAAAGLPDLVILSGPAVRLPHAIPRTVPPTLVLAEVKGPQDTLRDTQRVWADRLLQAGVAAELWQVSALPYTPTRVTNVPDRAV